jgi:hypothetical protein
MIQEFTTTKSKAVRTIVVADAEEAPEVADAEVADVVVDVVADAEDVGVVKTKIKTL